MSPRVVREEGELRAGGQLRGRWLRFSVVSDEHVRVVNLVPALLDGWNASNTAEQGSDDWPGMTADQIVSDMLRFRDGAYELHGLECKQARELVERCVARLGAAA